MEAWKAHECNELQYQQGAVMAGAKDEWRVKSSYRVRPGFDSQVKLIISVDSFMQINILDVMIFYSSSICIFIIASLTIEWWRCNGAETAGLFRTSALAACTVMLQIFLPYIFISLHHISCTACHIQVQILLGNPLIHSFIFKKLPLLHKLSLSAGFLRLKCSSVKLFFFSKLEQVKRRKQSVTVSVEVCSVKVVTWREWVTTLIQITTFQRNPGNACLFMLKCHHPTGEWLSRETLCLRLFLRFILSSKRKCVCGAPLYAIAYKSI